MNGRRALLFGLGLAALAALSFALRPVPPDAPPTAPPTTRVASSVPPTPGAAPSKQPLETSQPADPTSTRAPAPGAGPAAGEDAPQALSPVEAYIRYAVYPPHSRPLHANQADLIDWNRRHESARPDPDDPAISILFTADRYHVVGAESLSPVLDVRRDGEPAAVQVVEGHVRLPDGRAMPLALDARDGVHVGLVRPADWGLTAAARIELEVLFDAGAGVRTARFFAVYTPDDGVPARFGAVLGDAVVDGGLEVQVEVHVERAGLYLFDANLYAGGRPVAWTRSKPRLEPGTHPLTLRFFGKAIADRGLDGPYTVEQLRGALAMPGSTPPTVQMPPFEGPITTGAHGAADFSSAEWDDPRKQRRIARLKRLEAMGGPVVTTPARRGEPGGEGPR